MTGEKLGAIASGALKKVRINNRMRGAIRDALSGLTLGSKDPARRLAAAQNMISSPKAAAIDSLTSAIETEPDEEVRQAMQRARAAAVLVSGRPETDKLAAIETIRTMGNQTAIALLTPLNTAGEAGEPLLTVRKLRLLQSKAHWPFGATPRTLSTA